MSTRKELIQKLEMLIQKKPNDKDVKTYAKIALIILESDKTKTSLQGLFKTCFDTFNLETGLGRTCDPNMLLEEFMIHNIPLREKDNFVGFNNNVNIDYGTISPRDKNIINRIMVTIIDCYNSKISEGQCKDSLNSLAALSSQVQHLNLKLAFELVKTLGFKIYNDTNVLIAGTHKTNQIEQVHEWRERNSADLTHINEYLISLLETLVFTLNSNVESWEKNKIVSIKLSKKEPEEDYTDLPTTIIGVQTQVESLTEFQKYYAGLIPIKANKLGLISNSMTGGAGLNKIYYDDNGNVSNIEYNSYVDELVDTRQNFETGSVLEQYLNKFLNIFEKRNINIDPTELNSIKTQMEKLKNDEIKLINMANIIEKYFAIKKYMPELLENPTGGSTDYDLETMGKLINLHKNKLEKVSKKRTGLGQILFVMANRAATL